MSATTAIQCHKCGAQNLGTSQFCGGCGTPVATAQQHSYAAPHPQMLPNKAASGDKDWHEMAGLICGVVSMFLLGIFAAAPGLYFSWSARGNAIRQGRGTGLATTGLVLNGLGILATFAAIALFILVFIMAASSGQQPDPMMMDYNSMQGGYGY